MNSIYFTEEHEMFRESLKSFLQIEVVPHIEKWEKTGAIERFIWKKFGDMGFFGIAYPEAYGGLNLDLFYTVIFLVTSKNKIFRFCCCDVGTCLFSYDSLKC